MKTQVPIMTPDRAMLEWLRTQSKYKGLKITQGYLKIIILLGTTSGLKFNILEDTSTGIVGENRLARSDAFWATQHGFFIAKATGDQSTRSLQEQTFPNPLIFTDAGEREALQTLYNAYLKVEISDRLFFQKLDLKRFENASVAQQGLTMAAGGDAFGRSEFNPKTGMYEITPHIEFSGSSTPSVDVTLPESVDMTGRDESRNYAILYYRGFYIPDGARLGAGADKE